jgi:hypothetical protein
MSYVIGVHYSYNGTKVSVERNLAWIRKFPNRYTGNDLFTTLANLSPSVYIQELATNLADVDEYPQYVLEGVDLLSFYYKYKSQLVSNLPPWFQQVLNETLATYLEDIDKGEVIYSPKLIFKIM